MADWLDALRALEASGTAAVLVTVLEARGSTPREAGAKMVVTAHGQFGTIGGGNLEFQCTEAARAALTDGTAAPAVRAFPRGPALGQCCGGFVSVLLEPILPPRLTVALFGAGHVGQALVRLLAGLPMRLRWIDPRPDAFPPDLTSSVSGQVVAAPELAVAELPPGSLVLVMTHDHQLDFGIVAVALARDDLLGVGLIGSATKRARFASRLRRHGMTAARIDRLICPIGLPGIGSKLPAEIAVSVAAQILLLRDQMVGQGAAMPAQETNNVKAFDDITGASGCGTCVCAGRPALERAE